MHHEFEALLHELRTFFPGVEVEGCLGDDPSLALPQERALTQPMVLARAEEFLTGRTLARRALRRLGVPDAPLVPSSLRYPVWPEGFPGSISHTVGVRIAVVAAQMWSVGVDIERRFAVTGELSDTVASRTEQERFGGRPDVLTEIFSAKEAVFKATYPRTHQWLEFHDVEILRLDDRSFSATLRKSPGWTLMGWRRATSAHILSCVVLAEEPAA